MEVFFRELSQEEIVQVGKKAAEKVNLVISETGLNTIIELCKKWPRSS